MHAHGPCRDGACRQGDAIVIVEGSRILSANVAAAELVGADERVALVGMSIDSFFEVGGEPALTAIRQVMRHDPSTPRQIPLVLRRLSGETVDVVASFSMVRQQGRDVARVALNDSGRRLTRALRPRVERRRPVPDTKAPTSLDFGTLHIDLAGRRVTLDAKHVALTMKEFDLLAFLAVRQGTVFSRSELLHSVWHSQPDWQEESTVTEHVRRIRMKIRQGSSTHRDRLRTVRGVGYRFDAT